MRTAIFILTVLLSSNCFAQHWQDIATFPVREAAPYFLNENYGFVFTPGAQGPGIDLATDPITLWRTTDGGINWKKMNIGIGGVGNIWQLYFTSVSHGYMAVDNSGAGLYETNDSGSSWHRLRMQNPSFGLQGFISVYWADSELYAITTHNSVSRVALWQSSNNGYTWLKDSAAVQPEFVTGNRENVMEASGPNGGFYLGLNNLNDSVVFTSTTSGQTWEVSGGGGEQWNQFVFPHSQTIVLAEEMSDSAEAYGFDYSGLCESGDGGVTWHATRYIKGDYFRGEGEAIDAIAGDGCTVYVQRSPYDSETNAASLGCLRSTDYGQTWTNVGGPLHICDARTLSVTGHGAVVYAMADSTPGSGCHLWKTTDGGDRALTPNVPISVTMGHTLGAAATGGDTLLTSLCDSASLSIWLQFVGSCDYGGLTGVTIDGIDSSSAPYTVVSTHHPWSALLPDTASVTIYPLQAGTYPLIVHAHYTDDDFLGGDTTFQVILNVQPNPGTLSFIPQQLIDFGSEALCNPVAITDSLVVRTGGCNPIIDSMFFKPDSASFTEITLSAVRNTALPNNSTVVFPISFLPAIADTERGSILVFWNDGETQHVDTIRVQGAGVESTRSFSIESPPFTVEKCDSARQVITLTNTTCGYLELDSLLLPAGLTLPPQLNGSPQLPIDLKSGASDTLVVTIQAGAEGEGTAALQLGDTTLEVPAHMLHTDKGGTVVFDTTISIAVHVERGPAAELLSDTALDFGTVPGCDSATLPLVVSSAGCDTLSGIGYRVQGMRYRISGTAASLAPGRSDTLYVTFNPSGASTSSDSLVITSNAGTETVPLRGTSAPGASILSVNTAPRDFGSVFACQQKDTTIWLHNPGCETLTVDSGIFSKGNYASAQTYPIIIPAGDSVPVLITYIPVANQGSDNGAVTFYTNANTGPGTETVPLEASIIPPAQLQLSLSAAQAGHDGNVVTFYVLLTGDSGAAAKYLSGVSFDLTHNDNLLTFLSANGLGVTGQGAGTAPLHFTASALGTSDTLGTLTFRTYLTDSSETPLTLSNVSFSNTLGLQPDCIASVYDSGSGFTYLYNCGDHELQKFLQSGQVLLSIESVVPNPATHSVTIALVGADNGATCTLFDEMGKRVMCKRSTAGKSVLNVSQLPSGLYFVRATDGRNEDSRPVFVEH